VHRARYTFLGHVTQCLRDEEKKIQDRLAELQEIRVRAKDAMAVELSMIRRHKRQVDPPTLPYSVSMSLPLSEFVWVLHLYGCGTCTVNGYYVSRRLYSLVQAASGCCCLCSPLHPIL